MAGNHARRHFFDHVSHLGVDRAFAVDRLTQRIDHAAFELRADGHFKNTTRAFDDVAFRDVLVLTQDHGTHRVTLEVECQTVCGQAIAASREFEHFALHHVRQTMNTTDTVSHGDDRTLVANVGAGSQAFNTTFNLVRNFCWIEFHDSFLLSLIGQAARSLRFRLLMPLSFVPDGL